MPTTVDLWSNLAVLLDVNERIEAPSIPLERITNAVIGRNSDNVGYLELTLEDGSVLLFSRAGMTLTKPEAPKTRTKTDIIREIFPDAQWQELTIAPVDPIDLRGYLVHSDPPPVTHVGNRLPQLNMGGVVLFDEFDGMTEQQYRDWIAKKNNPAVTLITLDDGDLLEIPTDEYMRWMDWPTDNANPINKEEE